MDRVSKGDKVKVEYEGSFENGEIFDSSNHGDHSHPLEFVVGKGMVINGFDSAVLDMSEGEEKMITISPADGYGERRKELEQEVPLNVLPAEPKPKEGMILAMTTPEGHQMPVKIVKVGNETMTLDLNHPLAGKVLKFKIKLLKIMKEVHSKR